VIDYDDPVPEVVTLNEPLTADVVERLRGHGVSGVKVGPAVAADSLSRLAAIPGPGGGWSGWPSGWR